MSKKLIVHENRQEKLIGLIETLYRQTPKELYWEKRFEKNYIADLTRELLLKERSIVTKWSNIKLYEFSFNAIEYIHLFMPEYTRIVARLKTTDENIGRSLGYRSGNSWRSTNARHWKIRLFTQIASHCIDSIAAQ